MKHLKVELEDERKKDRAFTPVRAHSFGSSLVVTPSGETSLATGGVQLVTEISWLQHKLRSFDSKVKHTEKVLKNEEESRSSLHC